MSSPISFNIEEISPVTFDISPEESIEFEISLMTMDLESATGDATAESDDLLFGSIAYSKGKRLEGTIEIVSDEGDPIVPTFGSQVVPTAGKYFQNDIEIGPIPYAEVSNTSGGLTITIGE